MGQYRILIIYDIDGWCYHRRAEVLRRVRPPDFEVEIHPEAMAPWHRVNDFDLVFAIDYMASVGYRRHHKIQIPLVVSFNKDARSREELWGPVVQTADYVIVNNQHRWEAGGRTEKTCCISNGVDLSIFHSTIPIEERPLRALWRASSGPAKKKGYHEIIVPLQRELQRLGIETDFTPINSMKDAVYGAGRMREFWNSGTWSICASGSEGTPNGNLESMACGCVNITTEVGNVPEYSAFHPANCKVVRPKVEAFVEAILETQADPIRMSISKAAQETMRGWDYSGPTGRAQWFFQLFRRLIEDGPLTIPPFSYLEKHWADI